MYYNDDTIIYFDGNFMKAKKRELIFTDSHSTTDTPFLKALNLTAQKTEP